MVEVFEKSLLSLIGEKDRVLLAVSGGMDSVLMCYLFRKVGISFGIAHCNFQLRASESDADEKFVAGLAKEWGVPFFAVRFDMEKEIGNRKGSVQMVARESRYEWLEKIRSKNDFDYIATAHHLNDAVETSLYNFFKGTGVRGMKGILSMNGRIIRPILSFSKKEIENKIGEWNISFRKDASNEEDKYDRNKIRHHVFPVLEKINPGWEKTMKSNFSILKEMEEFLGFFIPKIKVEIITKEKGMVFINKEKLFDYPFRKLILFEILKDYGFNSTQVEDALLMVDNISGKKVLSKDYSLTTGGVGWVLEGRGSSSQAEIEVLEYANHIDLGDADLFFSHELVSEELINDRNVIYLNPVKIRFPLKIRKRRDGDFIYPLGMNGKKKKIKKIFNDLKLSIPEKNKIWIMETQEEIFWVVGVRADERFKVDDFSAPCLKIVFRPK